MRVVPLPKLKSLSFRNLRKYDRLDEIKTVNYKSSALTSIELKYASQGAWYRHFKCACCMQNRSEIYIYFCTFTSML